MCICSEAIDTIELTIRSPNCIAAHRCGLLWEIKTGFSPKAVVAAHSVARLPTAPAAIASARAFGHAAATAHMADQFAGSISIRGKGGERLGDSAMGKLAWQISRLPDEIRELVISGYRARFPSYVKI